MPPKAKRQFAKRELIQLGGQNPFVGFMSLPEREHAYFLDSVYLEFNPTNETVTPSLVIRNRTPGFDLLNIAGIEINNRNTATVANFSQFGATWECSHVPGESFAQNIAIPFPLVILPQMSVLVGWPEGTVTATITAVNVVMRQLGDWYRGGEGF